MKDGSHPRYMNLKKKRLVQEVISDRWVLYQDLRDTVHTSRWYLIMRSFGVFMESLRLIATNLG